LDYFAYGKNSMASVEKLRNDLERRSPGSISPMAKTPWLRQKNCDLIVWITWVKMLFEVDPLYY